MLLSSCLWGLCTLQKNFVHFDSADVEEIPWTILLFPDFEYFFFSDWKQVAYKFYRKETHSAGIISLSQAISPNCPVQRIVEIGFLLIFTIFL